MYWSKRYKQLVKVEDGFLTALKFTGFHNPSGKTTAELEDFKENINLNLINSDQRIKEALAYYSFRHGGNKYLLVELFVDCPFPILEKDKEWFIPSKVYVTKHYNPETNKLIISKEEIKDYYTCLNNFAKFKLYAKDLLADYVYILLHEKTEHKRRFFDIAGNRTLNKDYSNDQIIEIAENASFYEAAFLLYL
tara:strand:+ start:3910 stop:4488 length:579 start_codon:yes stop_codon:yes gene_type:complete